jgi:hypothetical protein
MSETLLLFFQTILSARVGVILLIFGIVLFAVAGLVTVNHRRSRIHTNPDRELRIAVMVFAGCLVIFGSVAVSPLPNIVFGKPLTPTPTAQSQITPTTPVATFEPISSATPTVPLTATPSSLPSQLPSSFQEVIKNAPLVISGSLQQNSRNTWLDNHDTCTFTQNAYHDINRTPNSPPNECYAQTLPTTLNTQKIAIQVDMKLTGNYGGIGFGAVGGKRYLFSVNVSNQYQINYPSHGWFSCFNGNTQPQPGQSLTLCHTPDYSPDQMILLQMVIQGDFVGFYINDKLNWVGPNLGISSSGTVIFAAGYFETNTDLSFQNLQIWQL